MMHAALDTKTIGLDRMRYNKNLLSSRLCYLAILFNVLYFVLMYEINNSRMYVALMGASIVYNLVFLLLCFLASEGVKNYKISYGYLLLGLGAGQIARIFILPAQSATVIKKVTMVKVGKKMREKVEEIAPAITPEQHTWVIVFLVLSAVLCLVAGVIAVIRSRKLQAYTDSLIENAA